MELNEVSAQVIDAAMKVHSVLGPGLLENAYEACLKYELEKRGLHVQQQLALPVMYDSIRLDVGYRLDLLVQDAVVVELKAVEGLTTVHEAQLLSYLRLSRKKIGLLINFNVAHLKNGIKRMVNEL